MISSPERRPSDKAVRMRVSTSVSPMRFCFWSFLRDFRYSSGNRSSKITALRIGIGDVARDSKDGFTLFDGVSGSI